MKKYLLLLSSIFLLEANFSNAQNANPARFSKINAINLGHSPFVKPTPQRNCGTMESLEAQLQADPMLGIRMAKIEEETQKQINSIKKAEDLKIATVYKIPVVVHVVYSSADPSQNISDAQIYSQIKALNEDYRKQNTDIGLIPSAFSALAADVEIEFCMASIDPTGAPTNGITRTQTSNTNGFSNTANDVKSSATGGKTPWNANQYLNMWVCDLQGQLLGYAQFPGGSASTDGVVIDYAYFGTQGTATAPFNKGRTATHEVGHYLNLRHIWGDANCGDDLVNDTPTQQTANYQCPVFPHQTCANTTNGDMFMNYMDYVDDACMQMFTAGQKARMIATLTGSRSGLLSNTNYNCTLPSAIVSCDTVANYSSSNILTVYRTTDVGQPGTGYIAGTNSFGDIGFAEKFTAMQAQQRIYGVMIGFAKAYGFSTASFNVKVWKGDFAGGNPGTILASVPLTIGQVVPDINAGNYTVITFNNPIYSSTAYYIGIEFNNTTVDTIALYCTVNGQVLAGRAYEKYNTGTWYPFTDATNSWGVQVSLAVAPIICIDYTGIEESTQIATDFIVYPNPSNGKFTVKSVNQQSDKIDLKVYNSEGALVLFEKAIESNGNPFSFDLSQYSQGLYFVEIKTPEKTISQKINLIH